MNRIRKGAPSEKNLRRRNFMIVFLFTAAALILAVWFLFGWRIRAVSVENNVIVSDEAILDATGVRVGRHVFSVSKKKVAETVASLSPYVKSVTVRRTLSGTLRIAVSEYDAVYYVEQEDGYLLLSDSLMVLEKTDDIADCLAKAEIRLSLSGIKKAEIGKTLTFTSTDARTATRATLRTIAASPLAGEITSLDLSNRFAIKAEISDRYLLLLGSAEALADKLSLCADTLRYLDENMRGVTGTLYAAIPGEVSFSATGVSDGT